MSISNLYNANNDTLWCDTLNCNHLNLGNSNIISFAVNGTTVNGSGIANFPYNMYCLVIGKYMQCTFNSPTISPAATTFTFDVPYPPAPYRPPSGNINATTSFGLANYAGNTPNTIGSGVMDSEDIGQQYIHCSFKLDNLASNGIIRGTFAVNLN